MKVFVEFVNWFLSLYHFGRSSQHCSLRPPSATISFRSIVLHDSNVHQIINPYADDTSYTVKMEKLGVDNFMRLLDDFGDQLDGWRAWQIGVVTRFWNRVEWMTINENGRSMETCPSSLAPLLVYIMTSMTLIESHGNLNAGALPLSLAGRTLIINHVLMSSLWYFIAMWAGSRKVLSKIKALMRNIARAWVSQVDCII